MSLMNDDKKRVIDVYEMKEVQLQPNLPDAANTGEANENDGRRMKRRRDKSGRSGSIRTLLLSFLAGALVVGGLAFASDRVNLFTGGFEAGQANTGTRTAASNMDAGLQTASLTSSESIASIYESSSPAVVKIENYQEAVSAESSLDQYFWPFFGGRQDRGGTQMPGEQGQSERMQTGKLTLSGAGTGFFYEADGYILTNEHVVSGAKEIKVTVQGYDEPLTAKLVGSSYELDLAVLKVEHPEGKRFPFLSLGDSNDTAIGEWVIAIGNPYGYDQTLTIGVLSAKERPITIMDEQGEHEYEHLLQTDASINPGNSGGPLIDGNGLVIGINTAVNAEAQGIGFAIPTTTINGFLNELKADTIY